MATSGTVTFRTNRNEIINGALRLVGGVDAENTSGGSAAQISNGAEALNLLVKSLEANGLQLWERRYGVIFPQKNQQFYMLGTPGPGGDHACLTTPLGTGFVRTTIATAAVSGATTIEVASITGAGTAAVTATSITDTYAIGIELDDGTMQWTTVSGAPSGTTVTLAAALTDDVAVGNVVNCYQTKLMRPLEVLDGFTRQKDTGSDPGVYNDIPHLILSREQYNRFGSKPSSGTSIQMYYDRQSNSGYLYIYPTTLDVSNEIFIEFTKPIDDFSSSADDYDLPQEWGEYLKFALAVRLAPEYMCPKEIYGQLKDQRDELFTLINGFDQEEASVFIQPSNWVYNQRNTYK